MPLTARDEHTTNLSLQLPPPSRNRNRESEMAVPTPADSNPSPPTQARSNGSMTPGSHPLAPTGTRDSALPATLDRQDVHLLSSTSTEPPSSPSAEPPSSPDPLTTDPTGMNFVPKPTIPRKRPISPSAQPQRVPNPPTGSFSFMRTAPKRSISSVKEGILGARDLLVQAANLCSSNEEQTRILDLIEILRDYTEFGRIKKQELSILKSQISQLETITKTASKAIHNQQKPSPKSTPGVQPDRRTAAAKPPTTSYANVAARDLPKVSEWTTVEKKKKESPPAIAKNKLSSRQLILIRKTPSAIDSLDLRNKINNAFASNGVKSPVIVSVTLSVKKNLVLTTTPAFNADYLLENKKVWAGFFAFDEALPITPWYKVAIHGIPTNLEDLGLLKSEISTFNNGLKVVGEPYWLSSESNRSVKLAGSVCIAFQSQKDAEHAIRNRLYLLGISVKAEKLHSTPPSTQCEKCQKFGHVATRCRNLPACKICSGHHLTQQHKCNTCQAKGKVCMHTIRKCANCREAHTADHKGCETYLATLRPSGLEASNDSDMREC